MIVAAFSPATAVGAGGALGATFEPINRFTPTTVAITILSSLWIATALTLPVTEILLFVLNTESSVPPELSLYK